MMHDGVTKSIFAHLIPAKGVDFPRCEKVVKMMYQKIRTIWDATESCFGATMSLPSILAFLRAMKLACTGDVVQETSADGDPQSNDAAESSVDVAKGFIKLAVESASGVEVPADHALLTWLVPCATGMHRRFSVVRDGKTAHESVERRAVPPFAQFGERVWWWMPLRLKFDKCDERRGAEPISSSLAAQTIHLSVPTQELVVNKRLIIQRSAVPAWRQSW